MDRDKLLEALTSEQGKTLLSFCVDKMIELSESGIDPNCIKGMGILIGKLTSERDSLKQQQKNKE